MARMQSIARRVSANKKQGRSSSSSSSCGSSSYNASSSGSSTPPQYSAPPRKRTKAAAKPPQSEKPDAKEGVYVLLTHANGKFYVGKSHNIAARVREHKAGRGASCFQFTEQSRLVKPLTAPVTTGAEPDWESWERNETLTRMYEYGINNVRGWMFTSAHMTDDDKDKAFQQICEKFDLCRRCGRGSHFVKDCDSKTRLIFSERLT